MIVSLKELNVKSKIQGVPKKKGYRVLKEELKAASLTGLTLDENPPFQLLERQKRHRYLNKGRLFLSF